MNERMNKQTNKQINKLESEFCVPHRNNGFARIRERVWSFEKDYVL